MSLRLLTCVSALSLHLPVDHKFRLYVSLSFKSPVEGLSIWHPSVEHLFSLVPDPGKGVCADPVNAGAILGKGGPDPRGGNKERQLSPDKGRGKT